LPNLFGFRNRAAITQAEAARSAAAARVAEVQVPQGAQVLALRTLKADGTVLEPESLDKDTVSLPGVGVGDAAEPRPSPPLPSPRLPTKPSRSGRS
jgi:hypothetical protein